IGEVVGSHLTPTYLVVDKNGRLERTLVGFKTDSEVMAGLQTTAPEKSSCSRFEAHEISRAMPELNSSSGGKRRVLSRARQHSPAGLPVGGKPAWLGMD